MQIKKIYNKIWEFKYIILLYSILLILMIPIFSLSKSAVPSADDFWYGNMARKAYVETGSVFKAVIAATQRTIIAYKTWQGTYSSIFLMSIQPAIFSLKLYRVTPIILIFIIFICPIFLAYVTNKYLFKTSSKYLYVISAVYSFITIQFMPSLFEGVFWFNAAWYYTFSFNIVLILMACIIIFEKTNSKRKKIFMYILIVLFTIFLGGTNYPQLLMLTIGCSSFVLLIFLRKNSNRWYYLIWLLILGACIAFNLFAPGNFSVIKSHVNLRYTLLSMIRTFTSDISTWTSFYITVAVSCISIPFYKKLMKNNNVIFINPIVLSIATFLILFSMYTPAAFIFHNAGSGRAANVRMMLMQLLIYINFINIYGYFFNKKDSKINLMINPIIATVLFLMILSSSFANEKIMTAWSIQAEYSIMGLEVSRFSSRMNEFFEQLEDKDVSHVNVEPLLTHTMLMPHINMFKDYNIGNFYDKEEVIFYK